MRLCTVRRSKGEFSAHHRCCGTHRSETLGVVSGDGERVALVPSESYPSLLCALHDWDNAVVRLRDIESNLEDGSWKETAAVADCEFAAPLPRCFQFLDGSAFLEHVRLARRSRGAEEPSDLESVPLMYQGISDSFLGANDPIHFREHDLGLDFEGEFGVILKGVSMDSSAVECEGAIALICLLNDISLRNLVAPELSRGFGFLQSKPASSFAPFAVTPDELGEDFIDGRVRLPLEVRLNNELFGDPLGAEMHFSFIDLIRHASRTRDLSPGTIIGSGTVSNAGESRGEACIVERRMRQQMNGAKNLHPYLSSGDRVQMQVLRNGKNVFGALDQAVC